MEKNNSSFFSSSSSSSPDPFSFPPFKITKEQLHAFHFTDRRLYKILIRDLERDPIESMKIMAFWMWLEKKVCIKVNLIHTLVEFPYNLINEVAHESVICLFTCQNDQFLVPSLSSTSSKVSNHYELAILPNLAYPNHSTKKLSLQDFHQNRDLVNLNVDKFVKDVCIRIFNDLVVVPLIENPNDNNLDHKAKEVVHIARHDHDYRDNHDQEPSMKKMESFYSNLKNDNQIMFSKIAIPPIIIPPPLPAPFGNNILDPLQSFYLNMHHQPYNPSGSGGGGNYAYKDGGGNDRNQFLPEDRTVFITFSKGYPVSEHEVKDFFTRRFGKYCIEAVYMQQQTTMKAEQQQQPLYARVVVSSASMVDLMVGEEGRTKYNIFGKHIWARKYVVNKTRFN